MSTGIVGADIPDKQDCFERENVNILIFVNVVFSLISNKERVKSCSGKQNQCIDGAVATVVKEHPCFHSNILLEKNPDKIYAFECEIQCQDLYCDENGDCIDSIGAYSKILYACNRVNNYLNELVFPPDSIIQVCINVLGFEPISDIAWGFAFMSDACCPNNVEDEALNELIMDEYEPFFWEYINNNWKVNVVYISLMEYDMVFEITNNDVNKNSKQITNSTKGHPNLNQNDHNNHAIDERNISLEKDTPQNTKDEKASITLEGHISKTEVNLSSFISFDHIMDCIPPFNVVRFLDRLTGVDKIENRIKENVRNSIQAYIRGDSSEGWRYLKDAGGASLDYVHKRLEVIAFVPGAGTIAGVVDGLIYTTQEGFAWGDLEKMEELRNRALYAYAGAVPFYKILKYGKPVVKAKNIITEGSEKIIKEKKLLSFAQKIYKKAEKAPKPKTKTSIKAFQKSRKELRSIKNNLEKMSSDPKYQEALREFGIKYEDAISNYKVTFRDTIRVVDGKRTPLADVIQAAVFQVINPYSTTNEIIQDRLNQENKNVH